MGGSFCTLVLCLWDKKSTLQLGENKEGAEKCRHLPLLFPLSQPHCSPLEAPWLSPIHSSFALSRLAPLASERNVANDQERGGMLSAPIGVNIK